MAATIMKNECSWNTEMYVVISIKIASNMLILNSGKVFLFSVQKI